MATFRRNQSKPSISRSVEIRCGMSRAGHHAAASLLRSVGMLMARQDGVCNGRLPAGSRQWDQALTVRWLTTSAGASAPYSGNAARNSSSRQQQQIRFDFREGANGAGGSGNNARSNNGNGVRYHGNTDARVNRSSRSIPEKHRQTLNSRTPLRHDHRARQPAERNHAQPPSHGNRRSSERDAAETLDVNGSAAQSEEIELLDDSSEGSELSQTLRRRRLPPSKEVPKHRRRDEDEDEDGGRRSVKGKERRRDGNSAVLSSASNANRKRKEKQVKEVTVQELSIPLPQFITVSDLSKTLAVKMRTLQNTMINAGYQDTRPDLTLAFADAELLALEFNITATLQTTTSADFDIFPRPPLADASTLPLRPPVVTIMGHVDHGKTTLLDKLRSASVAAGEAGGITQHVGAFSVKVEGLAKSGHGLSAITFIDTPGHAAFTKMRSRGAKVTDIVVLVVAADDGVMPQTKEVLQMVREVQEEESGRAGSTGATSGLQLVVALSKTDKPDADPERVRRELLGENVQLEDFGGDVPCVEISGKTGAGLDKLEETLVAISELNELRAERQGPAEGYVIESRVEKGFGNTAVVLIKRGAMSVGSYCVAGTSWCKVRRLMDSSGKVAHKQGYPGDALLVTGWRSLPNAGDLVLGVEDKVDGHDAEDLVKKCMDTRVRIEERRRLVQDVEVINKVRREEAMEKERVESAEFQQRQAQREARLRGEEYAPAADEESTVKEASDAADNNVKELRLIVKADYTGTVEAVVGAIADIGNGEVRVKIIDQGVGEPSDSDLARAQAVDGHILGFNVKAARSLQNAAAKLDPPVNIHCDDVIYRLMTYVSERCVDLLPPLFEARVTGEATIQEVFSINVRSRIFHKVAGCRVTNGVIARSSLVRIIRPSSNSDGADDGSSRNVIFEGRLDSLKHVKREVDEMRKGTECGLSFADNFQQFQKGDIVQSIYREKIKRTL